MSRRSNTLGPLVGYHGCDAALAERVLGGKAALKSSENDYDWLGPDIYFWVDSAQRGMDWALAQSKSKKSQIKKPAVIGAFIVPGLCLNLTDYGVTDELRRGHAFFKQMSAVSGTAMPRNGAVSDGVFLNRRLDCAVVKVVHQLREEQGEPAYDSVYGVFEEGKPLYEGAGFREKTHVQIAVRNPDCIIGYFRV